MIYDHKPQDNSINVISRYPRDATIIKLWDHRDHRLLGKIYKN